MPSTSGPIARWTAWCGASEAHRSGVGQRMRSHVDCVVAVGVVAVGVVAVGPVCAVEEQTALTRA
jgi:hypothetical protein